MKEKTKKRFRWWFIPLGLAALVLALVLALLLWMHTMLPGYSMIAMTSNFQLELSEGMRARALAGERDYTTLPDALTMADGTAVTDAAGFAARRAEILQLFADNVYGPMPQEGFSTAFEVVEQGDALNGAATRKQIKITVTTGKGASEALLLLYLPKTDEPVPVVLGLNFNGNHTVLADPDARASYAYEHEGKLEEERGGKAARWAVADAVKRGYGIATIYCNDFAPDDAKAYGTRVVSLFDEPEFKAVGAWAFGLRRGVDYLVQDGDVDAARIALIGHSRLGKAALWAAANDERVALVFSNDSGNTGASLSRGNHGERVKSINAMFPHWFCSAYKAYGGKEDTLPVDQNLLLASIAPRQVYVACAEDDLWADPQGAWNSLMASRAAFALHGLAVIDPALPEGETQPAAGTAYATEAMGYHVRAGWHDVQAEDWACYFDYMDNFLR